MKTLGLIGGLSWFSTAVYYRKINQLTNECLGGSNSAKILLYSVNFSEFRTLQDSNDWNQIENILSGIAIMLENAGADCIVLCTNTQHLLADVIQQKIKIPLLNIGEETAKEIVKQKISKVGLLGTKFTMEHSFFQERLLKYGIHVIIPESTDREFIHSSIFNELTKGIFSDETRKEYFKIIKNLQEKGAEGIVFGCTEIGLLIDKADCNLIVFDTITIHSKAAVNFALSTDQKE